MIAGINTYLRWDPPKVNNYEYGLVYEDINFFYQLLESNFDILKNAKFKMFKNIEYKYEDETTVLLHAGSNFLDVIRMSRKIDEVLTPVLRNNI
jgi:hypothetical protein